MKLIICENYDEMSARAAELIKKQINEKPTSVLGLATGSTPVGMYSRLVTMYNNKEVDFSGVRSVNLDEYYPLSAEDEQSYRYFMNKNLFDHVNIGKNNTHVPNGLAKDPEKEGKEYDDMIASLGGVDIQVIGIGQNGHIGFNEPDTSLIYGTHLVKLTENTIQVNSRFFDSEDKVPRYAMTMGIGSIMEADKLLLLISGASKHKALMALLDDKIDTNVPATMIKLHHNATVICDKDAYNG
ncbi:MAG: glucosamine-6-phosphate deaminase [Clostridia bacterium]|nr:glucosamine-6-phosphate deaminase [Clostridia bacterium]